MFDGKNTTLSEAFLDGIFFDPAFETTPSQCSNIYDINSICLSSISDLVSDQSKIINIERTRHD